MRNNVGIDLSHLSDILRIKAEEAIIRAKRPLSVSDIENYFRMNETELFNQIHKKCTDYTRIILSQNKASKFVKLKSKKPIAGVDKRTVFFGVVGSKYDENEWESADKKKISTEEKENTKMDNIVFPFDRQSEEQGWIGWE